MENYEPDWDWALGPSNKKVSLIATGFSIDQSGWFSMVLDRRPKAMNDGEWQSLIQNNYLPMPHWNLDGDFELDVTHYDPKWRPPKGGFDDASVTELIGNVIRDTLVFCRDQGAFKRSYLTPKAAMFVEDHEGNFGWPDFDTLRTDGRCKT
jgi:hypothetical protein